MGELQQYPGQLKLGLIGRGFALVSISLGATILFTVLLSEEKPVPGLPLKPPNTGKKGDLSNPIGMAQSSRRFILWLHGLGDSGPANEPIKTLFTSPEFKLTKWVFPSAPSNPVTCNYGAVMPSWFDIHEIPVTVESPKDESGLMKAVRDVHAIIDKEVEQGTSPDSVFVCGFSQGGALVLASVLLYPKTLGGGAVFSGWVPFNDTFAEQFPQDSKMTPILWSHGVDDRTVLFEAGQAGPPFLEKAGISCEFKAYPRLGHSISNEELSYLESWIKSRPES